MTYIIGWQGDSADGTLLERGSPTGRTVDLTATALTIATDKTVYGLSVPIVVTGSAGAAGVFVHVQIIRISDGATMLTGDFITDATGHFTATHPGVGVPGAHKATADYAGAHAEAQFDVSTNPPPPPPPPPPADGTLMLVLGVGGAIAVVGVAAYALFPNQVKSLLRV
jgi:hypothetical protein